MRVQNILRKNGLWLLFGSLCAMVISQSMIIGTDAVAGEIDNLLTAVPPDEKRLLQVVVPAIILATVVCFVERKCIGRYSVTVLREMQDVIAQKVLCVKSLFWTKESNGKLLSKMTTDMSELEKFTANTLPDLLGALISIVMVACYIAGKNLFILLITAVFYPVIIIIMTYWGNVLKRLAQKRRGNIDSMVEQVMDCVGGMDIVKSYGLGELFMGKIEKSIDHILDNEYKRAWIMHFSQTLQRFLFCIPNMVCPVVALLLVLRGDITIGEMTAYIVLIHKIISNMKRLPFLITDSKEKGVAIERLNQILGAPERGEVVETGKYNAFSRQILNVSKDGRQNQVDVLEQRDKVISQRDKEISLSLGEKCAENETAGTEVSEQEKTVNSVSIIQDQTMPPNFHVETIPQMEDVSFGYTEDQPVLHHINLSLEPHKTYAFVGLSGHGKSTLFRLLSGLEEDYTGQISMGGSRAIVSQKAFLFHGTIAENIGIGRIGVELADIVSAAMAAGIHDKIESLPDKYDTVIGENGAGLSGGEKQRLCIARALLSDADILLLDEPTASVDEETEKIIMNTLKQLHGSRTILLISHRLSLTKDADQIFVVDNGRIAEQGSHGELMTKGDIYQKLWSMEV